MPALASDPCVATNHVDAGGGATTRNEHQHHTGEDADASGCAGRGGDSQYAARVRTRASSAYLRQLAHSTHPSQAHKRAQGVESVPTYTLSLLAVVLSLVASLGVGGKPATPPRPLADPDCVRPWTSGRARRPVAAEGGGAAVV